MPCFTDPSAQAVLSESVFIIGSLIRVEST